MTRSPLTSSQAACLTRARKQGGAYPVSSQHRTGGAYHRMVDGLMARGYLSRKPPHRLLRDGGAALRLHEMYARKLTSAEVYMLCQLKETWTCIPEAGLIRRDAYDLARALPAVIEIKFGPSVFSVPMARITKAGKRVLKEYPRSYKA